MTGHGFGAHRDRWGIRYAWWSTVPWGIGLFVHMHLRGRDLRFEALEPEKDARTLLLDGPPPLESPLDPEPQATTTANATAPKAKKEAKPKAAKAEKEAKPKKAAPKKAAAKKEVDKAE